MKLSYLILAHNTPKIVRRLISSLDSENSTFFLHIDKKSDLKNFYIDRPNVEFINNRITVHWGDFSTVEAILALMREAFNHRFDFDYFILLSGSDYPIQPINYIEGFFIKNRGKEFINYIQMPNDIAGKPLYRLTDYKIKYSDPPIFRKIAQHLAFHGIKYKRNYTKKIGGLTPYGGSTWWALSRDACAHVLSFTEDHPAFYKFFQRTDFSDEMYFQTILANSEFRVKMTHNLTFTDWSKGGAHPATIHKKHIELFSSKKQMTVEDHYGIGEVIFARKFSEDNIEMLDEVDQMRIIKEGS